MANALPLLLAGGAALLLLSGKKKGSGSKSSSGSSKSPLTPEVKEAFEDAGVTHIETVSKPSVASEPVKIPAEKPGPEDPIAESFDEEFWRSRQFALMYIANHTGINCNPGKPDGVPGDGTRAAIKNFQQAMGLEPTGEWTQVTETAMLHMFGQLASEIPEPPPEVKAPKERTDFWIDNVYLPYGANPLVHGWALDKKGYPYSQFFEDREYLWQNSTYYNRPRHKDGVLSITTFWRRKGSDTFRISNTSYRFPYGYGDDKARLKGAVRAYRMGLVPKYAIGVYEYWRGDIANPDDVMEHIDHYRYALQVYDYAYIKYGSDAVDRNKEYSESEEFTKMICSRFPALNCKGWEYGPDFYGRTYNIYKAINPSRFDSSENLWKIIANRLAFANEEDLYRNQFKPIPSNAPRARF